MQQQAKSNQDTDPVFTPLDAPRGKRLRFKRSDVVVLSGNLDVRGLGKKARVRIGATVYDVYGCSCDLPNCECDAYIVPVKQQGDDGMTGQPTKQGRYRFFQDSGHSWLEVPRAEVVASGAKVSAYSYYDPATDMAYLEEDCDATAFIKAAGLDSSAIRETVQSSKPRRLPAYGPEAIAHLRVRGYER